MSTEKYYEVDSIVDEQYCAIKKKILYQTYWTGYRQSTWEPMENLQHLSLYKSFKKKANTSNWKKGLKCLYKIKIPNKNKYEWIPAIISRVQHKTHTVDISYYYNNKQYAQKQIAFGSSFIKKQKLKYNPSYKRVRNELQQIILNPISGIGIAPLKKNNIFECVAYIKGPNNTPYYGGCFWLKINFDCNKHPFIAPKIKFVTKIYHCNINNLTGKICLDVLNEKYTPALSIEKILLSINILLQNPNPYDPLDAEISTLYITDKQNHDKIAKQWTQKYATDSMTLVTNKNNL